MKDFCVGGKKMASDGCKMAMYQFQILVNSYYLLLGPFFKVRWKKGNVEGTFCSSSEKRLQYKMWVVKLIKSKIGT